MSAPRLKFYGTNGRYDTETRTGYSAYIDRIDGEWFWASFVFGGNQASGRCPTLNSARDAVRLDYSAIADAIAS